jgi:MoaA/NifB/PqqE/SkfB family radical SAM enzyme
VSITKHIDRVTAIPVLMGEAPAPLSCKIEITSSCPYRCTFCAKSINDSEDGEMDRALYSRLLREMRAAGVQELAPFFIGESFQCRWLPEAIKEAKDVGFPYVFLTTNGATATPSRVRECMAAGLDSLKFSINFHSADQLASVAQVHPGFWRKAINHLKEARKIRDEEGFKTRIYASSIKFDGAQGEAMQAVVDEIKEYCDETYWLPLFSMNGASKANGMKPGAGNPGRLDNMRDPLPCWSVWQAHIDRHGRLIACCFGDTPDGGHIMADLKTTSFVDGWNSDTFRSIRKAHLSRDVSKTACAECAAGA